MFAPYDEDGNLKRHSVTIDCQKAIEEGETVRVEQHHKKDVDINQIIKRHGGRVEMIAKTAAMQNLVFDDVTGNDFQEAAIMIAKAEQSFNSMPSALRNKFNNNPAEFLDFVQNKDNQAELVEMGLANAPEPEAAPIQVEVINPPPAETPAE